MYKLMIVDDEALVREAIREQMNWHDLGFMCIADCEDGEEALETMKREAPDVVLTDIYMPFMDGLELTRQISVIYPDTKIVILTGFDDFEYAQQAIKLKAYDFILKPFTSEELGVVLLKLKKDMDMEAKKKQDYERLKRQLFESLPLLRERFLERMVTSPMPKKELIERCKYFNMEWDGPSMELLAFDIDEFVSNQPMTQNDQELLRFALFNIVQEMLASRTGTAVFRDRDDHVLAILSGKDEERIQEDALHAAEEIRKAASLYLPITISVGISRIFHYSDSIHLARQSALSALDYRFVIGNNEVISITDMERRERPALFFVIEWEKEIITKLKTATETEMDEFVERLFAEFREHLFPVDACYLFIQRIALSLVHTVYEMGGEISKVNGDPMNPLTEIDKFATLSEIKHWMKDLCRKAVSTIRGVREDYNLLQLSKAETFIKQQYMDPMLVLNSVCKHVSMSTSYFSTLFKNRTGKTFIEYVTQERMEKAKELLKLTKKKSSEIAYEVGYNDPHYFSAAFKKQTGETPTDYRRKMTIGNV